MRLNSIQIDGFRNLRNLSIDFDADSMTTVLLGANGSGKSYLLEAIARIFKHIDLDLPPPAFSFKLRYSISGRMIGIESEKGAWALSVDDKRLSLKEFQQQKNDFLPDTIFAYYSGDNDRLEDVFYDHQHIYYRSLLNDRFDDAFKSVDMTDRRLFYARSVHGVLALLALLAEGEKRVLELLHEMIGVDEFHSALLLLRRPWYAKGKTAKDSANFWGAAGRPGRAVRIAAKHAFLPMQLTESARDDYRSQNKAQSQHALYLRNKEALSALRANFQSDLEFFEELESIDISDLYRWVQVWVTRAGVADGDVSYGSLSEGERQLLMVLGLMRLSRNKRVLFLLDEPDTHLNPRWQYQYHKLIDEWSSASGDRCHILMTTHNPLIVGNLHREQVRVLATSDDLSVTAEPPVDDPIVMGIEGLLKSELFGLRTTLSPEVVTKIDRHLDLLANENRSKEEDKELRKLAVELNELGVALSHPNPYFEAFAKAMAKRQPKRDVDLTAEEIAEQAELADEILDELLAEEEASEAGLE